MQTKTQQNLERRQRRHRRIRARLSGTAEVPRLAFFRSSTHIYAQLIVDTDGHTLAAASSCKLDVKGKKEKATKVAELIAKDAIAKSIKKVVFDRGGFKYAGVVCIFADSARNAGLEF